MAEANTLDYIKQEFPVWYNKVNMHDDKERPKKRLIGIEKIAATSISSLKIEALVCTVYRTKQLPNTNSITSIRQKFKDEDELFEMQGNDGELEVLCGTILRALFSYTDQDAAIAALSVACTSFQEARQLKLPMDLIKTAEYTIAKVAEYERERPDITSIGSTATPTVDFASAAVKAQEQWDQSGVTSAFEVAAKLVNKALEDVSKQTDSIISAANHYIAIQDEELQMLGWIVGEWSSSEDKPFKKVSTETQPLVFAKELADCTQFLPGPFSIKGLLARAGVKSTKKTVPEIINACNKTWLASLVKDKYISPITHPIHFAILRKLETGDDTLWVAGWSAVSEIKAEHSVSMLDMGVQFYRERLLIRFTEVD